MSRSPTSVPTPESNRHCNLPANRAIAPWSRPLRGTSLRTMVPARRALNSIRRDRLREICGRRMPWRRTRSLLRRRELRSPPRKDLPGRHRQSPASMEHQSRCRSMRSGTHSPNFTEFRIPSIAFFVARSGSVLLVKVNSSSWPSYEHARMRV